MSNAGDTRGIVVTFYDVATILVHLCGGLTDSEDESKGWMCFPMKVDSWKWTGRVGGCSGQLPLH